MRGLLDSAQRQKTPNGSGARPTVGLAVPMTNDTTHAVKHNGARRGGIAFDARDRLAGAYDDTQFGEVGR